MSVALSHDSKALTFADLTTMGVGGRIEAFIRPTSRVGLIEAVEEADSKRLPLAVIGGGANLMPTDVDFSGIVVRDTRQDISLPDEATPVSSGADRVHVNATAGTNWDDLVSFCVRIGLSGIEALSGIPGTVGASVVQNIGAYGCEVGQVVDTIEVWDRQLKVTDYLRADRLDFGYRTSLLKRTMYRSPAVPDGTFFPTPRYVVLSVTLALVHRRSAPVVSDQLAGALGAQPGAVMDIDAIRRAVLSIRAAKCMLEDPRRYANPWMAGCRRASELSEALDDASDLMATPPEDQVEPADPADHTAREDLLLNRHSCGSFFTNPLVDRQTAAALPDEAPRFPAPRDPSDPQAGEGRVKVSAAWLIDHAGFHKGYRLAAGAPASLSTVHTLALTNRGGATASDLAALARTIQSGVESTFGIHLVPEPVTPGIDLS
ncbi:FAD-binding protein [Bifidobacterium favimelis]|uniref:UDP-N-acetylenolpyruvoylglucosamine reductase n=1 Tax=Bifidobacterium favimelis TaxID=3122979 RepID=A0ABU8ZMC7_9BIFI